MASQGIVAGVLALAVIVMGFKSTAFASTVVAAHTKTEGIVVDLLHYHHLDLAKTNLTLTQRVESAAKSSLARVKYFHDKIYGKDPIEVREDVVFTSPLYSAQGAYVMKITLGTPPRNFLVYADTGSDLCWVQTSPCTSCFPQPDPIFNPGTSFTYRTLLCTNPFCNTLSHSCSATGTCLYKYYYGDQSSTQGDLCSDVITMTTTSGTTQAFANFVFGCGHRNQGTFTSVDGLAGLGKGPLSLVSQLGPAFGYLFSYCLVDFYSAPSRTSPLLFGSTNGLTLSYTPLLVNTANPTFYYVNLVGITINGAQLLYPAGTFAITSSGGGGLILDSGTTFTYLDTRAYYPFVASLASLIPYRRVYFANFDLCYNIANVGNPHFPIVVFQFQGVSVTLPANNLFIQLNTAGDVCLAFQASTFGFSIYGNFQQQNFQIAYDRANSRVGFLYKPCLA